SVPHCLTFIPMISNASGNTTPYIADSSINDVHNTNSSTLLPPISLPPASNLYAVHCVSRTRTLAMDGATDHAATVSPPANISEYDWLAINTYDMWNEMNIIVGSVQEYCTKLLCPTMNAGDFEYAWADDEAGELKKVSALEYMSNVLDWSERKITDRRFMPNEHGQPYPANFKAELAIVYKRFFRLYAHIYYSHFKQLEDAGVERHLNHSFKHFVYFVRRFELVDESELAPLQSLIDAWKIPSREVLIEMASEP
ncbi:Maintenance of ploidy protein mob1, putative, partial [Perkinsus marinus ATCC 50983]